MMSPGSVPATPFPSSWVLAICHFHREAGACRHSWGPRAGHPGCGWAGAPCGAGGALPWALKLHLQPLGLSLPELPGVWVPVGHRAASRGCRNPPSGGPRPGFGPGCCFPAVRGHVSSFTDLRDRPPSLRPASRALRVGVGRAPAWGLQQPCLLSLHPGDPQDRLDLPAPRGPRPELRDSKDRPPSQLSIAGDK